LGILTSEDAQYLFLDTPGIHKPLHKLGEFMVTVATETIEDADIVLWLVDITVPPTEEDRAIGELLLQMGRKRKLPLLVLGLNHADRWSAPEGTTGERVNEYANLVAPLIGGRRHDGAPLLSTAIFSATCCRLARAIIPKTR
jgi:GTP-binding protein Era